MNLLFYLAIMLFAGLLFGRLLKLVKLPNVTGYLIAGLVLGPFVTKILSAEQVESLSVISNMALSFIAFTVGLSFKRSYFKRVGMTPVVIALLEALVAVFLVQGALIAAGFDVAFSIVLGAIAAATAPAATIMVIKQYGAKGPVTDMLMAVVAIDDAMALVAFGFAVSIAGVISGNGGGNIFLSILQPLWQVVLSLLIGAVMGVLFKIPLRFFKKSGNRLIIIIGFVFMTSALATLCGVSELLACMALGSVFCNISTESDSINDLCDFFTPPLFELFFVVSGAGLDVSVLPQIGVMGAIYVVVRCVGKYLGAFIGAKIMKAPDAVAKYIGPTLIPQAGVAIGLTIVAQSVVPHYAAQIRAVILCGTLIYELVGPAITKITLKKAGEIQSA
ncbi:MAG: cation:proton antiporter [Ruminococcus sp.]|nr:cation:proton antiporter [Ruminococcus sp.]